MAIDIITGFNSSSREQLDKRSGPYASTSAALAALDTNSRAIGMPIYVITDGTQDAAGNYITGNVQTYRFTGGISDGDLIEDLSLDNDETVEGAWTFESSVVLDESGEGIQVLTLLGNDGNIVFEDSDNGWGYIMSAEEGFILTGDGENRTIFAQDFITFGWSGYSTKLSVPIPSEDIIIYLPTTGGTLALTSDIPDLSNVAYRDNENTFTEDQTFDNDIYIGSTDNAINVGVDGELYIWGDSGLLMESGDGVLLRISDIFELEGANAISVINTNSISGAFNYGSLTASRGWTLPDASGTLALTSDYVPITGGTFTGGVTYESGIVIDSDGENNKVLTLLDDDGNIVFEDTDEGWGYITSGEEGFILTRGGSYETIYSLGYIKLSTGAGSVTLGTPSISTDITINLPSTAGTLALTSDIPTDYVPITGGTFTGGVTFELNTYFSSTIDNFIGTNDSDELYLYGDSGVLVANGDGVSVNITDIIEIDGVDNVSIINTNSRAGTFNYGSLTASRGWTLPDASGTLALTSDIPTDYVPITGGTFTGGITVSQTGAGNYLTLTRTDVPSSWYIGNLSGNDLRIYNSTSGADVMIGIDGASSDNGNALSIGASDLGGFRFRNAGTSRFDAYAEFGGSFALNDGTYSTTLSRGTLTANNTLTFPTETGNIALSEGSSVTTISGQTSSTTIAIGNAVTMVIINSTNTASTLILEFDEPAVDKITVINQSGADIYFETASGSPITISGDSSEGFLPAGNDSGSESVRLHLESNIYRTGTSTFIATGLQGV